MQVTFTHRKTVRQVRQAATPQCPNLCAPFPDVCCPLPCPVVPKVWKQHTLFHSTVVLFQLHKCRCQTQLLTQFLMDWYAVSSQHVSSWIGKVIQVLTGAEPGEASFSTHLYAVSKGTSKICYPVGMGSLAGWLNCSKVENWIFLNDLWGAF